MTESSGWDELLHWARMLASKVDLDAEERSYKLSFAERMRDVRQLVVANATDWPAALRRTLGTSNLLNFYFLIGLTKNLESAPQDVRDALLTVWAPDAGPAALDTFAGRMANLRDPHSPGNVLALGTILLMSVEPTVYPPFRARAATTWLRRVGRDVPGPKAQPSARYQALLDFLDDFVDRARPLGPTLKDRLDAQGLAWVLTQWKIEDLKLGGNWTSDQINAFRLWRGDPMSAGADAPDSAQRAWLVRVGHAGTPLVDRWHAEDFVSLVARYLGDVDPGSPRATVRAAVEAGYQHQDYSQRQALTGAYFDFLTRMKRDDVVVTVADERVYAGQITSDAFYRDDPSARLRREVAWSEMAVDRSALPAPAAELITLQGTVVDLTDALGVLLPLASETVPAPDDSEAPGPDGNLAGSAVTPALPPVTDALARSLHIPREPLQDIADLLQSRHQVVLYGPPGTGKTYIARKLAQHLVGGDDLSRVQLVQFHPAYAYEDFFEGFRPTQTASGQATFTVQAGPLRLLAARASDPENRGVPYVLIIDEMNRANLAKVFGELYFLLEYRDAYMPLQYSPTDQFRLPNNLFIIGTMNTADRSIAMVDAAIRRRFPFVELHPDTEPIRSVLANFLAANGKPMLRARLLDALNAALDESDRDLRIGPSYLMRPEAETDAGLQRIWTYDILPLLDEHYYGRLTRAQIRERFGLDTLRAQLRDTASPDRSLDVAGPEPTED